MDRSYCVCVLKLCFSKLYTNLTSRDNTTANEPKVLGPVNISKLAAVRNKSKLTTVFFTR